MTIAFVLCPLCPQLNVALIKVLYCSCDKANKFFKRFWTQRYFPQKLAPRSEWDDDQRRGLIVLGAHEVLRRLQMPGLWIKVQMIILVPRAHT